MSKILVTGATGTFGAAVVDALSDMGADFRVLVRDPARFKGKCEDIAVGDFADQASLDSALNGIERVFLASFDRGDMPGLQGNLLDAAKRQGVRHVARISTMHVDNPNFGPIMADHARGEQQLEDSGLAFTHLRPSWVLQNFFPTSSATPVRDGKIRLPAGDGPVSFVDARDVATVAAVALTEPGHEGVTYELTGAEARTHRELAEVLSTTTGKEITFENLSLEHYLSELEAAGWPALSVQSMEMLFSDMREGGQGIVTDHVQRVTNRPPLSIEDFARDYVGRFTTA